MTIDLSKQFANSGDLAHRTPNALAQGMEGSAILAIAQEVRELIAQGKKITNLTIGDFNPKVYAIPDQLKEGIKNALDRGETNYPPAIGVPELREAIRNFYRRELGLDYPEGTVQVGSGARPPLYAAYTTIIEPGDTLLYSVPCWNVRYYAYLNKANAIALATTPENGFMPTAADIAPYLSTARMLCLNSPLNPCGTVISEGQLREICRAILDENHRREAVGERPLILFYDQVYWKLTFGGAAHHTPVGLEPEMANYTIMVDAVSKWLAGTGVRVGWSVSPPWIRDRMKPLIGHMGAWAGRAEQIATAELLNDTAGLNSYIDDFGGRIVDSLQTLRDGLWAMRDEGLPVDALDASGAIYLSAKFDIIDKYPGIECAEDLRSFLLHEAGVAIVPFTAFGAAESGWVRFSVGAVTKDELTQALKRIRSALIRTSTSHSKPHRMVAKATSTL